MSSLECRFEKFVNEMDSILKRRQETIKKYDINNTSKFCFFEEISDLYYREKFHSDILYTILNPDTKQIGEASFCKIFIDFLELDSNKFVSPVVKKEVPTNEIKGKKGYIDLLILDKAENPNNAIIIENKINYAPDMKNQLVRYMKYVDDEYKIKNPTIVYLTLIGDKEPPEVKSYSENYKKYSEKRDKLLKKIKAVDDKKSLVSFLDLCINHISDKEKICSEELQLAKIYISQYRMLLNHLGGKAYMSKYDKEFIKYVYEDKNKSKEKMEIIEDIIDIWKRRGEIITEIVKSELNVKQNEDYSLTLECNKNKDILVFYFEHGNNPQIGFVKKDGSKFSTKIRSDLLKRIKSIKNITVDPCSEGKWIYGYFDVEAKEFNVYKDIIDNIKNLQKVNLCTSK